jgi:PAS domain S-box-containing protein
VEAELRSSQFLLAVAMGVGGYIGLLHLWMWGRREGSASHLWVAFFCLGSLGFQIARTVQGGTSLPSAALAAGRFQAAMAPVLIFSLVGFARSLAPVRWSPALFGTFAAANALLGVVMYRTPLFIPRAEGIRYDLFGEPFLGTPAAPALAFLLPYILASFSYVAYEVNHSPELAREERRALLLSLGAYAVLGVASVLSAMDVVTVPVMTQYGPLVVALGLSYTLLLRHQRQRVALERTAEDHAAALGESEARYRSLVDSAPVGIVACKHDGRLVAVNRRMLDILGAPPDAQLSDSGRLNILPEDGFDASSILGGPMARALAHCMSTGESTQEELSTTSRWGAHLQLRLNVASVSDAAGQITGAQAIVEDVSSRRRLEDQLRQWQKMEAVGHLAAGIAHEINNPMAYVRTNLTVLREEWAELISAGTEQMPDGPPAELQARADECEELIAESLEGVDRTIAIVRDVKDFAHTGEARMEPLDLNEVVESSLRMATGRLGSGVRVERSYGELAPVVGSSGQLQQVLLNLLMNAIHALDGDGLICVSTWEDVDATAISISDTGCGIDSDVLEHLFDPFFTTKPTGEGTGLGLYISYEIVRAHGGEIRVQSRPGEGSRFEVRLSRARGDGGSSRVLR